MEKDGKEKQERKRQETENRQNRFFFETTKETSPEARPEIMYEKAYRNCRPVPDLYCIHSESKLEECRSVPKPDPDPQNGSKTG